MKGVRLRANPTEPPRYHMVVQHQLSVEQAVSVELYTDDRDAGSNDIAHFIRLFTAQHEIARERAFAQAEKLRDLTQQKLANLQAEEQRLTAVVARLRAEAARLEAPEEARSDGDSDGAR